MPFVMVEGSIVKKYIIILLGICLLIGIPFIGMDLLSKDAGNFNNHYIYKKIKIDLKEKSRENETVLVKELSSATELSLEIQSDSDSMSYVSISSDQKLIGSNGKEERYGIRDMTGNSYVSPTLLLQPGKYEIKVTNTQAEGKLVIGYKEKKIDDKDYERLLKVDSGDLNNPPEGYELVYSGDLSGLNCSKKVVYSLSINHNQDIGICVYTNSSKGNATVDFIGKNNNFTGLVTPKSHAICEQTEGTFPAGDYEFQLTSENADGQMYIFIKK